MKPQSYLITWLAPMTAVAGFLHGGLWTYGTLFLAFGIIPALELLTPIIKGTAGNLTETQEKTAEENRLYDYFVYAFVPIQFGVVFMMLYTIQTTNPAMYEIVGMVISTGICCGAIGINVAHELGHRRKGYERTMAKSLLLTSLYMHWFVEHNKGHHARVATKEDPASSRFGENVYAFMLRSIVGGYISSWKIEARRLRNLGKSPLNLSNSVLRYHIIQGLFLAGVYFAFGPVPTMAFTAAAVIGFCLLELVNYIEHYGLSRDWNGRRYEKVLPIHSWNSNHTVGRMFLFNLSRHSDHHANAARPYQILRHFDASPQMPTGYPGMMILSLFPPAWFMVMNPRVAHYREIVTEAREAFAA